MMDTFISGFLSQHLRTATDEELLNFIDKHVLSQLNRDQRVKLRDFIIAKVPGTSGK